MKSSRVLLLVCVTLLMSNSIYSQQRTPMTPEQRAAKITDWMKTNLNLNEDQVSRVSSINLKYAGMNEQLRNNGKDRKQNMDSMKSNEKAKEAELKGVFTPDQFKTYLSKKEEMKKQFREEAKERRK